MLFISWRWNRSAYLQNKHKQSWSRFRTYLKWTTIYYYVFNISLKLQKALLVTWYKFSVEMIFVVYCKSDTSSGWRWYLEYTITQHFQTNAEPVPSLLLPQGETLPFTIKISWWNHILLQEGIYRTILKLLLVLINSNRVHEGSACWQDKPVNSHHNQHFILSSNSFNQSLVYTSQYPWSFKMSGL